MEEAQAQTLRWIGHERMGDDRGVKKAYLGIANLCNDVCNLDNKEKWDVEELFTIRNRITCKAANSLFCLSSQLSSVIVKTTIFTVT